MESKSDRILTSVKLSFLIPLRCEINVFTAQDPSQNETKSLQQKKNFATRPPRIRNFQPQGASGWQHELKRLPKGFLPGGPGAAQKHNFCCPKLSWGQDSPQESPCLDFGSSSNQFWIIFTCFRFFSRLVSFLSAPAVGRGSNRKQLTIHSKLNDGCDGNALHNSAQHKHEKCWWPVRGRPKASGFSIDFPLSVSEFSQQ